MIDNISNTLLFICSRMPFGLIVFSDEYGLLEVESVSKNGMIECTGRQGCSLFLPYNNIKPILYPAQQILGKAKLTANGIRYTTDCVSPYFSDILELIPKGEAMSVYDLPFNPYENDNRLSL